MCTQGSTPEISRIRFYNPSLTLPATPTLANPTRGFGSQINNSPPQTVTEVVSDLQEPQSDQKQLLEPEIISEKPLTHQYFSVSAINGCRRSPQPPLTKQGCFIRSGHDFVKSMSDKFREVGKRKITSSTDKFKWKYYFLV